MRMFIERISDFVILGMALGIVDLIITKTKVFEGVRNWIKKKSKFFGDLFNCPICLGTWISLAATGLTDRIVQTGWASLDLGITWFFMDFWVCLFAGMIYFLYKDK